MKGTLIAIAIFLTVLLAGAFFESPETFKKTAKGATAAVVNKTELFYQSNLMLEDMKARYVKGYNSVQTLKEQLIKVMAQKRVNARKYENFNLELANVCEKLKALNTDSNIDVNAFTKLKVQYDSLSMKTNALCKVLANCESSITNLNFAINKITIECETLKYKIDEVETTIEMCNNLKELNSLISINTEDFSGPAFNMDNLNKDLEMEQAKLEVLIEQQAVENEASQVSNENDMKQFIESL